MAVHCEAALGIYRLFPDRSGPCLEIEFPATLGRHSIGIFRLGIWIQAAVDVGLCESAAQRQYRQQDKARFQGARVAVSKQEFRQLRSSMSMLPARIAREKFRDHGGASQLSAWPRTKGLRLLA